MNLPGDEVFDAHWQDGRLIVPVRSKQPIGVSGKIAKWMDPVGWLMWSREFGFRVSTGLHNIRATGVR